MLVLYIFLFMVICGQNDNTNFSIVTYEKAPPVKPFSFCASSSHRLILIWNLPEDFLDGGIYDTFYQY